MFGNEYGFGILCFILFWVTLCCLPFQNPLHDLKYGIKLLPLLIQSILLCGLVWPTGSTRILSSGNAFVQITCDNLLCSSRNTVIAVLFFLFVYMFFSSLSGPGFYC